MDRRAKKLEKKRVKRAQIKRKANALAARAPSALERLARSAARGEWGPCFTSAGWDDTSVASLVNVLVTRRVPAGWIAATALVDRTCLGVKDAFLRGPMSPRELGQFVETVGMPHGGMLECQPLIAQSIVFHAIDYARALGFEPHPDFPGMVFGPRPQELVATPWHASERPIYIPGPHDDQDAIVRRLTQRVGPDGFECFDPMSWSDDDDEDARDEADEIVHSPLERTVTRDGDSVHVMIYRGLEDEGWVLEVEDSAGGSTVWDDTFETDQAALDTAMRTIDAEGIMSFSVPTGQADV